MKKNLFPFLFFACTILLMSACRTVRVTEKETVAKGSSETSHSESLQSASLYSVLNTLSMRADSIVIWMQDGGAGCDRQLYPAAISTANGDYSAQSSEFLNPDFCPDDDRGVSCNEADANGRVSNYILPSCRKRYRPPENTGNNSNADRNNNSNAAKKNSPLTSSRYRGISKIVLAGLQLDAKTESVHSSSLSSSDSTRVADCHEEQKSSASKSSPTIVSGINIIFCIIIVILAMKAAKWLWQKRKNKS